MNSALGANGGAAIRCTTGNGGDLVGVLPHLPPDFYDAHPVLTHIRAACHSQDLPPAPDAVLAVALARVAALVPVETHLPGDGGTVNYLSAVVGPPGSGKSTANLRARALIPSLGDDVLDSAPLGSGEGMVEAYLRTVDKAKVQCRTSAFFYVDEAETLINRSKMEASTTLSTLRSMWSGAAVGAMNARTETTRHLNAGAYRFAAVIGFQAPFAMQLIADDAAGTPQRFLYVSSLDPSVPDVGPSNPGPLAIVAPRPGTVHVDREIRRLVGERARRIHRGELVVDALEQHRYYLQLKTACLLSVLCGDGGSVTLPWWNLAARMVDNSRRIVLALTEGARLAAQAEREAKAEERIETREMEDEKHLRRVGALVHRHATEAGRPLQWGYFTKHVMNSRDRKRFTVDDMVRAGFLRPAEVRNHYLPGRVDVDKWTRTGT